MSAKLGRPLMLNDIAAKLICDAVAAGNTRRCAAALASISYSTLKNWIRAGRHGEERFLEFLARLEKADAMAEAGAVMTVRSGAQGWQGSAWWLERRRRRMWRRPPVEQVKPQEQDLSETDAAELYAAVEKLKPKKETG